MTIGRVLRKLPCVRRAAEPRAVPETVLLESAKKRRHHNSTIAARTKGFPTSLLIMTSGRPGRELADFRTVVTLSGLHCCKYLSGIVGGPRRAVSLLRTNAGGRNRVKGPPARASDT
ncbi:hypothetical protein EVAR_80012_1 [Eumeta japonica]|uniref:Uncharacterized protein n=1 Tax=Eumeta variegata TaxID=151549 RepID=A0A4C1WKF5_EUMVA|nr:hypothetical protein EVAR_80012_1 [Eumeta japonica]